MKNIYKMFLLVMFPVVLFSQELTPEELFKKVNDAIVIVRSYDFNGNVSKQGSGVILNDKGILVTNFHIFAGNDKIEIRRGDKIIEHGGIIGIDVEKDVLVLKINENTYPNIPVGQLSNVQVGQKVYAIGNPMGMENSLSSGLVSGIRDLKGKTGKYIQITASISAGSSGGAVLNANGEFIGISTLAIENGQNLNFAISCDDVMGVDIAGDVKSKLEAINLFFKGYNNYIDGNYKDAISSFDKYLAIVPDDSRVYNYRGLANKESNNQKDAVKDFTKAIVLNPLNKSALSNRAELYYKMEEYELALKDITTGLKLDPENKDFYYVRGLVNFKLGDYDKAIKDYTQVIKRDDLYLEAYFNRGMAHYENKDYERALIDLRKCVKMEPSLAPKLNPLIDYIDILWQERL